MTMPDSARLDRLTRRLSVATEAMLPDERTLTESIYRQRVTAWQEAMSEYVQAAGYSRRGTGPRGMDEHHLRALSRTDAESIRATFTRDLERQIAKLYAVNPEGDRQYYIRELSQWADERAAYKDRQIALANYKTTRHYALLRFREENKVQSQFRFVGPAPVCDDCASHLAAGVVGEQYVEANPTPLHPNCPHEWVMVGATLGVERNQIWTG